jgi:hypothetical protein
MFINVHDAIFFFGGWGGGGENFCIFSDLRNIIFTHYTRDFLFLKMGQIC